MARRSQLGRSALRRSDGGGGGGGGGTVANIIAGDAGIVITNPAGPVVTVGQLIGAKWPVGNPRVYAVDGAAGNDANAGFADAASNSAADYRAACVAAGAVAKQTIAGLAAIFPAIGAGRMVVILIAAGTYTDDLATVLGGVEGYLSGCPLVRGTVTDATAGATKFTGTTADETMAGAVTATGMNAAGYNPTGAPSSSQFQCLQVGGAPPAFGAEPAVPLGWRVRFDSATVTAALRNQCRQVCQVSGTDTVRLQTVLPAIPVAGDVFYLEMGGVVIPAFNYSAPSNGQLGSQFVGIRSSGAWGLAFADAHFALCGAASLTAQQQTTNQLTTDQSFTNPILGAFTVGGGFRSEAAATVNGGQSNLAGLVSATSTAFTSPEQVAWGPGCAARNVNVVAGRLSQGTDATTPANLGTSNAVGIPHTFGDDGVGAVQVDGSDLTFQQVTIIGSAGAPCIQLRGKNSVVFAGVVNGATGNGDVGLDMQNSQGSQIQILATAAPTVTGAVGNVRWAGPAFDTWTNFQFQEQYDTAGNHIYQVVQNGEYDHTITPSVTLQVNNSGAPIGSFRLVAHTGANLQFKPASVTDVVMGLTSNGAANGEQTLIGSATGFRIVTFDAAPTLGALVYISATTPGLATTTNPGNQVPLGIVAGNAFAGNLGLVEFSGGLGGAGAGGAGDSALWTFGLTRVYAVDGAAGNDANKGFADPVTSSAADYAVACAAAGAVALQTFAGLSKILPRIGNGRTIEIVIAAGTYTGGTDLGALLRGLEGYTSVDIRGTSTNATAGSVAFAGTTADATYVGAVTATGMNAAGYNPTGAPTSSVIQCLQVGGAAPAFGAEPAIPEGWRIRFDSATATVALRNQCRQVCRVSGTDTVSLQTALPAVPAAGDVFYLEQAGVVVDAYTINCPPNGGLGIQVVGIISPGTVTVLDSRVRMTLCGGNVINSNGTNLSVLAFPQGYTHPAIGALTVGGGFRCVTASAMANGQFVFVGLVCVTDLTFNNASSPLGWGAGCAARAIIINSSALGSDTTNTSVPTIGVNTGVAAGIPRIFGGSGTPLTILGSRIKLGVFNIEGSGANPCISVRGMSHLAIGGIVSGTTGNNDVGMDLTQARGSVIVITSTPTVTGALGDVRLFGGQIVTWASLVATGLTDSGGNRFVGTGGPLSLTPFSGSVIGAVGAVVSYLADTGPVAANQIVALRRPTSFRLATRLRVTNLVNTSANATTVTLYKNAVATAMTVSIPAATAAATKFVDAAHPILFLDGDDYDLRMDDGADVGGVVSVSAALEWAV